MGDGAQNRPVVVGERGSVVLSVQDAELVAQHDDLDVLRAAGTYSEAGERREEAVQNAVHRLRIGADFPCSTVTSEFWAPTPATGFMFNHVDGRAAWDVIYEVAQAAGFVVMPIGCGTLLPDEAMRGTCQPMVRSRS